MARKSTVIDDTTVMQSLPECPVGYHYELVHVSPLIRRIDLHHHRDYVYAEGERVVTIWGFIKGGKVFPPKRGKPAPKSVCQLLDARDLSGYTSIIPTCTDLTHLL